MQKLKLKIKNKREAGRLKRHRRVRKKIFGTADAPRLCIHRSLKNMEAQLVNDIEEKTIFSFSSNSGKFKQKMAYGGNVKAAFLLGEIFAQEAKERKIERIVFDRAGYAYHGRVKAFAEGARKKGLKF
ncbi:MAG: 50S ribosomal protein L18 [Candidatus Omnitrophica bacterium]|nr:50S ribosomal protein L18 [Candidatus Omnitrophota bacterium]